MSRSGYSDECEYLALYRANVDRAIMGKRGQSFLKEMAAVLDAMPEKRLIAGELIADNGECCAMGTVFQSRQADVSRVDYDLPSSVAKAAGISTALAAEIEFLNDDDEGWHGLHGGDETPEGRWLRMRKWLTEQIKEEVEK